MESFPVISHHESSRPAYSRLVLVCEKEDIIRRLLIRYIEHATHWEVHGAADGLQAQSFLSSGSYDMVVSSVFLDFKNGFEILHLIHKELKSDIPVILLSADTSEETVTQAFEMGAYDFISMPVQMKELVTRMKFHMSERPAYSWQKWMAAS